MSSVHRVCSSCSESAVRYTSRSRCSANTSSNDRLSLSTCRCRHCRRSVRVEQRERSANRHQVHKWHASRIQSGVKTMAGQHGTGSGPSFVLVCTEVHSSHNAQEEIRTTQFSNPDSCFSTASAMLPCITSTHSVDTLGMARQRTISLGAVKAAPNMHGLLILPNAQHSKHQC